MVIKVAKSENFDLAKESADRLIESSGNDIRQVINILQMWNNQASQGNNKTFSTAGCKDDKVMINNYDAAHRLLNHGAVSLDAKYPTFRDKVDLFFVDFDWVPLLIQESYLGSFERRNTL